MLYNNNNTKIYKRT